MSEHIDPLPTEGSLTAQTLHGLTWSYIDTIINAILQIGYTAVMARLLSPADFGLVAMANVVLRFGSYFAQMGMGSALVQKKELSQEEIRAGFTSSVLLSLFVYAIIWILAPLSTLLFKNQDLIPIVRVMGLSFILTGLSITSVSLLRRSLAFRSIAIIDIISFVLGYGIGGIYLAMKGFGVWSLVAAALLQSVILAILAYLFTRHSLVMVFKWSYYKHLYSFGSRVSIVSFLEFISSNLDTLAIGHFLSAAALGIYNRAFMLVNLPMWNLVTSFSKVLLPSYSKIQNDKLRLKKAYLSSNLLIASILLPVCTGLSAASREAVLLILGEKWQASVPILQILAMATPFYLLAHLIGILLEASAELNIKLIIQSIFISGLVILFLLLGKNGVVGFALALLIGEIFLQSAYSLVVMRFLKINYKELIASYLPGIISGILIGILIYTVGLFLRHYEIPLTLTFSLEILVGSLSWICLFIYGKPFMQLRHEIQEHLLKSGIYGSANPAVTIILTQLRILPIE